MIALVISAPLEESFVLTVTDPLLGVLSDFCRMRSDRAARREVVGVSGTSEVRLFVGVCGRAIKAGAGIGGTLSNAEADGFFVEELGVGKGMNEVGEDDCLATGVVRREGFLGGERSRVRVREDI